MIVGVLNVLIVILNILYAENKAGKCLSEKYVNSKTKMKWENRFHNIKVKGSWCSKCNLCPLCQLWKTNGKLCNNKLYQKTKEYAVVKYLKENLPNNDFIHNELVGSDCTKYDKQKTNGHLYPDIRLDLIVVFII